jgi:hypothetical protein
MVALIMENLDSTDAMSPESPWHLPNGGTVSIKWEYTRICCNREDSIRLLNQAGSLGWEAYSSCQSSSTETHYLKRRL